LEDRIRAAIEVNDTKEDMVKRADGVLYKVKKQAETG